MQHHQCDFDGDQLVITPASKMPNIASETRHANQDNEYDAVEKREKVDYNKATDSDGDRKYTKLRQIAVAIAQNKIGWVATLIGRVQSSNSLVRQTELTRMVISARSLVIAAVILLTTLGVGDLMGWMGLLWSQGMCAPREAIHLT